MIFEEMLPSPYKGHDPIFLSQDHNTYVKILNNYHCNHCYNSTCQSHV